MNEPGELIEFRTSRELYADLVRWIADEAQFPAVMAGDFTVAGLPSVLVKRRETAAFAIARLLEILRKHGVKAVDMEVAAACARLVVNGRRLALELEGSAR